MYPFWKRRPGNINLVCVRVFNFVRSERQADVLGKAQTCRCRPPSPSAPGDLEQVPEPPCEMQRPSTFQGCCAGSRGSVAKPLEQACVLRMLHADLSSEVAPGAPDPPLCAESSPGGHFFFVSISLRTYRNRGNKAEWATV